MISINSKIAFFKIVNEDLCYFMSFIKACVPKLSPFTSKLRQRQKNKSLQSLATLVKFLVAGVRLELTTFGLWAPAKALLKIYESLSFCWYLAIYRGFSLLNIYAILGYFGKQFFLCWMLWINEIFVFMSVNSWFVVF